MTGMVTYTGTDGGVSSATAAYNPVLSSGVVSTFTLSYDVANNAVSTSGPVNAVMNGYVSGTLEYYGAFGYFQSPSSTFVTAVS